MKYWYLSRNGLIEGAVVVYDCFSQEVNITIYRTGNGKEDTLLYIGENIPNDWVYDNINDVIYSESDRPSPYHSFINGVWIITDEENYKKYIFEKIEGYKDKALSNEFNYLEHRQSLCPKCITLITSTIQGLELKNKITGIENTVNWYFSDGFMKVFNLAELQEMFLQGFTFVQKLYDTENKFKNEIRDCEYSEFIGALNGTDNSN